MTKMIEMTGTIEAILFDCDGVVLDSETVWDRCETEFLRRRGIAFDIARTKPLITGLGQRAGVLLLQEQYGIAGDPDALVAERLEIIRGLFEREVRFTPGFPEFYRGEGPRPLRHLHRHLDAGGALRGGRPQAGDLPLLRRPRLLSHPRRRARQAGAGHLPLRRGPARRAARNAAW